LGFFCKEKVEVTWQSKLKMKLHKKFSFIKAKCLEGVFESEHSAGILSSITLRLVVIVFFSILKSSSIPFLLAKLALDCFPSF